MLPSIVLHTVICRFCTNFESVMLANGLSAPQNSMNLVILVDLFLNDCTGFRSNWVIDIFLPISENIELVDFRLSEEPPEKKLTNLYSVRNNRKNEFNDNCWTNHERITFDVPLYLALQASENLNWSQWDLNTLQLHLHHPPRLTSVLNLFVEPLCHLSHHHHQ